jgi:hypothetical protein
VGELYLVTSYRWTLPLAEAPDALLATQVSGETLAGEHGRSRWRYTVSVPVADVCPAAFLRLCDDVPPPHHSRTSIRDPSSSPS